MRISLVPPEAVRHVWKDVEKVLKKSVATAKANQKRLMYWLEYLLTFTFFGL